MNYTRYNDVKKCCFPRTKVSDFIKLLTDGSYNFCQNLLLIVNPIKKNYSEIMIQTKTTVLFAHMNVIYIFFKALHQLLFVNN